MNVSPHFEECYSLALTKDYEETFPTPMQELRANYRDYVSTL